MLTGPFVCVVHIRDENGWIEKRIEMRLYICVYHIHVLCVVEIMMIMTMMIVAAAAAATTAYDDKKEEEEEEVNVEYIYMNKKQ